MFSRPLLVAGCASAVVALLAVAPRGSAQPLPIAQSPASTGVSVVGQGIVLAQPDTAHMTLGVDVSDQSLANAQAEAARRMDAIVARLKADGIADSDIRTTAYNVNPQYDGNQQTLRGYQVQNLVDVRSTNVTNLGPLIDDAIGAGASRVYGIRFEASNMQDLKNQARDQAMQNARAKAEQLARDAGVGLGKPLAISENDAGGVTPVRAAAPAPLAAVQSAPQTPIQPGELQVQTTVEVIWSIQ